MPIPPSATAVNTLLAIPWSVVSRQRAADAERDIETTLENCKLATKDGTKNGLKWAFSLGLKNVKASVDLESPPALTKATANAFTVAAPVGGWNFSISGDVKAHASVKAGGTRLFSWSPGLHFGLRIRNFQVVTSATLDLTRPVRPKVATVDMRPSFEIVGGGFLPVDVPVSFTSTADRGKLAMRARMTGINLKDELGALDAKLTADLVVSILDRGEIDLTVPEPEPFDLDTAVPLGKNFQTLKIEFNGQLRIKLDKIGKVAIPFAGFDLSIPFPASDGIGEIFTRLSNDLPQRWGDDIPAPHGELPDLSTLTSCLAEIEAAAEKHMPHGAVLSFEYGRRGLAPALGRRGTAQTYSYLGDEDSAIWTGHYLAAESLRYAASQDPASLTRVKAALEGIRRLFWVTTDAVGINDGSHHVIQPVSESEPGRRSRGGASGILSRTAKPDTDEREFATTSNKEKSGPLAKRPFYYIKPEGGWRVRQRGRSVTEYKDFSAIPSHMRSQAEPIGPVWYGWGCGDNHPVSRDQYAGAMLGLALAWQLVPDADVRRAAGRLIEDTLDFLLENKWTVRLPPDWRIQTDFLGDLPKQLAFLRIGKTINAGKYGTAYDEVADAAELAWLSPWFSSFDPIHQYYKFNLSHAAFFIALMLEDNVARREHWYQSYLRLWGPVAHHRNAYFDLVRILAEPTAARRSDERRAPSQSNPQVTIDEEIKHLLGEWVARWAVMKGPNNGPLRMVGDASHQLQLWPDKFGKFTLLDGRVFCLAKYALPVDGRSGHDKDFMWQRDPFRISVPKAGCKRSPRPDTEQILKLGGKDSHRESPGVDYLLAYWLAVYLGILPGATPPVP